MAESAKNLVVVAYDIPDDRRRARMANRLLSFGARIQGSVYELWLTPRQFEAMWCAVGELHAGGDLIRCYTLCGACERRIRSYGMPQPERQPALIF